MKRMRSISTLALVISLTFGVIWLSPAFAAGVPEFSSLGQIRAEAEGMYTPGAMDLDKAGNLYVADGGSGKVYVFDKYGALVEGLDLGVSGRGLAVTPDGSKLFFARDKAVSGNIPVRPPVSRRSAPRKSPAWRCRRRSRPRDISTFLMSRPCKSASTPRKASWNPASVELVSMPDSSGSLVA